MAGLQHAPIDDATTLAPGLADKLRNFSFNGSPTVEDDWQGIPFFHNEFWTAGQRQAHSLHEVSYRACFKPQLPEFFIQRLTKPGDTVYDPFMGRGTTPIQANLMGRRAIGNDINPLSTMLARPRIAPPDLDDIRRRLELVPWDADVGLNEELIVFYHRETLQEICALREYLIGRDANGLLDPVDDWIRMVAINRLTGHSPGFFSVYSMPPNQAVSAAAQRKINEKRNQIPPRRHVDAIILKKSTSLLKDGAPESGLPAIFLTAAADGTDELPANSVNLIVTSPPFLDIVQYAADNWLRCWFAGLNASRIDIAMHGKPEGWVSFVKSAFGEFGRVVAPSGHVAFEVGEVRNGSINLEQLVIKAIEGTPFNVECVLVNVQEFTKTANCWGVKNNARGTNSNRVVVARRR